MGKIPLKCSRSPSSEEGSSAFIYVFMKWVLCCQSWIPPYPKTSSTLGCGSTLFRTGSIELFSWLFNEILTISCFSIYFQGCFCWNWLITSSCRATYSVEEAEVLRSSAWIAAPIYVPQKQYGRPQWCCFWKQVFRCPLIGIFICESWTINILTLGMVNTANMYPPTQRHKICCRNTWILPIL